MRLWVLKDNLYVIILAYKKAILKHCNTPLNDNYHVIALSRFSIKRTFMLQYKYGLHYFISGKTKLF
ncbi:hypothetical protein L0669_13800 [Flavobacterium bizetiae]|uniref:hypothetical protein n=1 Tax=Flavobacterium bizetiae TaxID=2704140 RepID=UPI0021E8C467|nr:hypothetical protein [Flavobacterium bizetiae]UTN02393.1 hypothetical protein L0669_13800 [Flavobacterium bizetiae]